jgi:hypothetical protein
MGRMPKGWPHLTDAHWYPIWDTCQELGIPIHFHGSAGINAGGSTKCWDGYSERQAHSFSDPNGHGLEVITRD